MTKVNHSRLKALMGWSFHYNDFVLTTPRTLVDFIPTWKPLMSLVLLRTLLVFRWELSPNSEAWSEQSHYNGNPTLSARV